MVPCHNPTANRFAISCDPSSVWSHSRSRLPALQSATGTSHTWPRTNNLSDYTEYTQLTLVVGFASADIKKLLERFNALLVQFL